MSGNIPPMDRFRGALDLSEPIFVRRSFSTHGRLFTPGMEFPWQALGYRAEKVRELYRQNYLSLKNPRASALPVPPASEEPPRAPVLPPAPVKQAAGTRGRGTG